MSTGDSHGIVLSIFVSKSHKWKPQAWVENDYHILNEQFHFKAGSLKTVSRAGTPHPIVPVPAQLAESQ
jgi:hypothetical protein